MENQFIKLKCKLPDHKEKQIQFIQLDKNCEAPSRLFCNFCALNYPYNLSKFVILEDLYEQNENIDLLNWPDVLIEKRKQISFVKKSIIQDKDQKEYENYVFQIKEYFKNLENMILDQLNVAQKEILLKIGEFYNQRQNNQNNDNLKQKLSQIFDINPFKKIINEFKDNNNNLEAMNKNIQDQINKVQENFQDVDIQKSIEEQLKLEKIVPVEQAIQNLEKDNQPIINSIVSLQKKSLNGIFNNYPKLKMIKSQYQNSQTDIEITDGDNNIDNNNNETQLLQKINYKQGSGRLVIFSEMFSIDHPQQFRFKVTVPNQQQLSNYQFIIGTIQEGHHQNEHFYQSLKSGNAFDVFQGNTKRHEFEVKNNVQIRDKFYQGMEIKVDIHVQENKFIIYGLDRNQNIDSEISNRHIFEKDVQNYRFIISAYFQEQVADCQFL